MTKALLAIALLCAGAEPSARSAEHQARLGPFRFDERDLTQSLEWSLRFSGGGKGLVFVRMSEDGNLHIHRWIVASGRPSEMPVRNPERYEYDVSNIDWPADLLSLSGDGGLAAFRGDRGTIFVCDTVSGKLLHRFGTKTGCPLLAPDGKVIAHTGPGVGPAFEVIEVATGKVLGAIPTVGADDGCFSADHRRITVCDSPTGAAVWEMGQPFKKLISVKPPDPWRCARGILSPDGRLIAAQVYRLGEVDHLSTPVYVWEVATGKPVWHEDREGLGGSLRFSPDSQRLAGACASGLSVWNTKTGAALIRIRRPQNPTKRVKTDKGQLADQVPLLPPWDRRLGPMAFAPDSKTLATVGADGFIRLWNTDTGAELTGK